MAPQRQAFLIMLTVLYIVNSGMHLARPLAADSKYNYSAMVEEARSHIPSGSLVMALPNWWLGLADYRFSSINNINYYNFSKGYSLAESLNLIRPDVVIVDTDLENLLVNEGYFSLGSFKAFKLPKMDFENFLIQHGKLLYKFYNPWHGRIEIYKL